MMKIESPNVRHMLASLEGAKLPQDLGALLRDEVVSCGWVQGFAVLESLELLVTSDSGRVERVQMQGPITGQLQGAVGMGERDVAISLRGVFSKRGAISVETVSGVVHSATARHGEMHIVALDDVNGSLAVDPGTGLDTLRIMGRAGGDRKEQIPVITSGADRLPSTAEDTRERESKPGLPATGSSPQLTPGHHFGGPQAGPPGGLPLKPLQRAARIEEEGPVPDAGDLVEHFAFGRCEVVKSDGDRLHVRLSKDGRIKEIALEMLKVTPLASVPGSGAAAGTEKRLFQLSRKL